MRILVALLALLALFLRSSEVSAGASVETRGAQRVEPLARVERSTSTAATADSIELGRDKTPALGRDVSVVCSEICEQLPSRREFVRDAMPERYLLAKGRDEGANAPRSPFERPQPKRIDSASIEFDLKDALRLLNDLKLTAEQRQKIAELKEEYREKVTESYRKVAELESKYKEDRQEKWTDRLIDVVEYQKVILAEYRKKAREVLTPEQAAQMKAKEEAEQRKPVLTLPATAVEAVVSGPTEEKSAPRAGVVAKPVQIKIEEVLWHALPEEVISAAIGPDQRVWYLLGDQSEVQELPQTMIRQVVEREYAKPSPQLQGVQAVFFETAANKDATSPELKRVWMLCGTLGSLLLGYDGKQWIERRTLQGRSQQYFGPCTVFHQLDGAVVFLDRTGAHALDAGGANWKYQSMQTAEPNHRSSVSSRAWPDPDRRGLTVVASASPCSLWRYHQGAWCEIPLPEKVRDSTQALAVKLSSEDFFRVNGTFCVGLDGRAKEIKESDAIKIGPYSIPWSSSVVHDRGGTLFAYASKVQEGDQVLGSGLIIQDMSGSVRFVPKNRSPFVATDLWHPQLTLPVGDGGRAWVYRNGQTDTFWDLGKCERLAELPSRDFQVIASTADGTAFTRRRVRYAGEKPGPLMVFRSLAKDTRKVLASQPVRIEGLGFCIASDGSIWASRGEFGLERFDGKEWRSVSDVKLHLTPYSLIPAQNGWVMSFVGLYAQQDKSPSSLYASQYLLLNGQKSSGEISLRKWIPQDRKRFLEAFSKPSPHCPWYACQPYVPHPDEDGQMMISALDVRGAGVVVDKHQNIWASSLGSLCVVTGDRVIDVSVPPPPNRVSPVNRRVACIASLGDGEYVFVRLEDGNSYFASLANEGRIDLIQGPKLQQFAPEIPNYPLRDHQGGLWVKAQRTKPSTVKRKDGQQTMNVTQRIVDPEKQQDFEGVGEPVLVDALGCVWLAPRMGSDAGVFTIWSPDGRTATLKIPGRFGGEPVTAGQKGHVYVWTASGVQECLASNPNAPTQYTLGPLYRLAVTDGEVLGKLLYSHLGFLVSIASSRQGEGPIRLHLFPLEATGGQKNALPAPGEAAKTGPAAVAVTSEREAKPAVAQSQVRLWKDRTGRFSVKAAYQSVTDGKVTLRKADETTIRVPVERLSEEDQEYLRRRNP